MNHLIKKLYLEMFIRVSCGCNFEQALKEIVEGLGTFLFYEEVISLYEIKKFIVQYHTSKFMHPVISQLYRAHIKYDMLYSLNCVGEETHINLGKYGIYEPETIKFFMHYSLLPKFKSHIGSLNK